MIPSGRSWLNSVDAQYRRQRLDQNISLYAASSLIFGFALPLIVVTFAKLVECLDIMQEDMDMKSLFCKKKKGLGAEHALHERRGYRWIHNEMDSAPQQSRVWSQHLNSSKNGVDSSTQRIILRSTRSNKRVK